MDEEIESRTLSRRHVVGTLVVLAVLVGGIVALAVAQGTGGAQSPQETQETRNPPRSVVATSPAPQVRQSQKSPVVEGGEHGTDTYSSVPMPGPTELWGSITPVR